MKTKRGALALWMGAALAWAGCSDDSEAFDPSQGQPIGVASVGQECVSERTCMPGLKCQDKRCVLGQDTPEGAACRRSGECAQGLYCEATLGRCQRGGELELGQGCAQTAQCEAGLICQAQGLGGVCAQPGTSDVGQACQSSAQCLAGLNCALAPGRSSGTCTAGVGGLALPWSGVDCQASRMEAGPARFFFEVPRGPVTEFYRLPYPNDIRLKQGRPDLSDHPRPGPGVLGFDIVDTMIQAIERDQRGFGLNHATFVRASRELSFDSLNEEGALRLVNISPESPQYNQSHPISWFATGGAGSAGRYICQNWLAVRPFWGRPLEPGVTYALVLTTQVKDKDGQALVQDQDFAAMLGAQEPSQPPLAQAWRAYAPLRAWIAQERLVASQLAVAAVFTTQTPWRQSSALRQVAREAVEATLEGAFQGWVACDEGVRSPCEDDATAGQARRRGCAAAQPGFAELQGRWSLPVLQRGQAPYLEEGGELDESPRVTRREDVCVAMTVPAQAAPEAGWPVLIYAHGTGGTYRSHVQDVAAAVSSIDVPGQSPVGMVVVGWDQVQHATRRGMSTLDPEPLVFNYGNPAAALGNFLQGAADVHAIVRYVQALGQVRDVAGRPVKIDPTKIYFMGHSQGGTTGPIALPFEPDVRGAALSGAGGGLNLALLYKSSPVDSLTGLKVALQDPDIGANHPVLSLIQGYFEPVDPINYAPYLGARQLDGLTTPRHIFHPMGVGDTYTPPQGMKALALALRAAYLNPVFDEFRGGGITLVDEPVRGNVGVMGQRYTVAGRQYEPDGYDGHFVSFRHPQATRDLLGFWRTLIVDGTPTISP